MPWKETCTVDERKKFIMDWLTQAYSKSDLCRDYGISRPTGDKWIERFQAEGWTGLSDRSRAPKRQARAVPPDVAERLVELRERHPSHGPKKIRAQFKHAYPEAYCPAESTIGEILAREGLVMRRRRKARGCPSAERLQASQEINQIWCADFKGRVHARDGCPCDPLTITDAHSRYLLACHGLRRTNGERVKTVFERVFRAYGLPEAIRTDNGPPFASVALGGLTPLAVWWIRLGIRPERIEPGCPQQNGRHERMHRTLKAWLQHRPAKDFRGLRMELAQFLEDYNNIRPHEALGQVPPSHVYAPSERVYTGRTPAMEYPAGRVKRYVKQSGEIAWKGRRWYLSVSLAGENVGLEECDENVIAIYFGPYKIGELDERKKQVLRAKRLETDEG